MSECIHSWTTGRKDEKGSWCKNCGGKVFEVETRPCEGCEHYKNVFAGAICKKHMMAVSPIMLVTFKIADGTCWQERHNVLGEGPPERRSRGGNPKAQLWGGPSRPEC